MARTGISGLSVLLFLNCLCFAPLAVAAPLELTAGRGEAAAGGEARIPIRLKNGQGVGAIQFHLLYAPEVLEWKDGEVDPGTGSAVSDFKVVSPGRVRVAVIYGEKGVTGDVTLLTIRFRVAGSADTRSPLAIEVPRAWTHEDIAELQVTAQSGEVTVTAPVTSPPASGVNPQVFLIGGGVAVLILAAILVVWFSRKKHTDN